MYCVTSPWMLYVQREDHFLCLKCLFVPNCNTFNAINLVKLLSLALFFREIFCGTNKINQLKIKDIN